ncbi:DUF481 domain-containing protein [Tamlana sp. 2_MG-2023]|uniref:DUF481 domain-containing protein n=1 Tax=unclassified Tamlana TaxID=2614803 RepID=UPI0026E35B0C|nr:MULTISPECIES: DUF481 domain-containing protein [unclassified Tamlana]MDO6761399.1 DUF481 domain-containing protein [Tamlana sp. 2_MG-2023]MDO6791987.1 DUF481 domain-containing protein [Tamlana sp. 1_MG-2023]
MIKSLLKNNLVWIFLIAISFSGLSQVDTLKLKNKVILTGEVKRLSQGVITIETDYSDSDFKVEFDKVAHIHIIKKTLIILSKGRRSFGHLTTNKDGKLQVTTNEGEVETFSMHEMVALNEIDDAFWERFTGSIDLGFNLSKANNLRQFSVGGALHYMDKSWLMDGSVNVLNSYQDDVEDTKRTDAKIDIIRIIVDGKWFLIANTSFLSNTEQALKGRISPSLGAGKFIKNNNKLYWGIGLGFLYNIENYIDSTLNKTSSEAFISSNINLFNFDDLSLTAEAKLLPSLSQKGRIRSDIDFTIKYDLPSDFYVKAGFTLNYDNQPAIEGNDTDYVITTGIGWKFD